MTERTKSQRGQPLLALLVVACGWAAIRMATWESPFPVPVPVLAQSPDRQDAREVPRARANEDATAVLARKWAPMPEATGSVAADQSLSGAENDVAATMPIYPDLDNVPPAIRHVPLQPRNPKPLPEKLPPAVLGGHSLMLVAALAGLPVSPELAAFIQHKQGERRMANAAIEPLPGARPSQASDHWSLDGWVLARGDSENAPAAGQPSYGRSQAGAVLRYKLMPGNGHNPRLHTRVSSSLAGPRENELAVGLSARPVPQIPVVVAGELRATDRPGGTDLRPAAFAYTELPRFVLPAGLAGEVYVQAGYVGGGFPTAFADGQFRVDGRLTGPQAPEVRAGGGAWGGAQKDAERLDIGPTASVSMAAGQSQFRLSTDWRIRVLGDAAPASGPALTISASF